MPQVWDVTVDGRYIRVNTGDFEISRIHGIVTFRGDDPRGERCCNEESFFASELGEYGERIVAALVALDPRASLLMARNSFKLRIPDERLVDEAQAIIGGLEAEMCPRSLAVA